MGFLDDYEPVEDRLREFWADHPDGRIETELIYHAEGDYIIRAMVWREDLGDVGLGKTEVFRPSATGLAHDSVAQLPPNMKASALEVAETSAIGRALANLGYAPKGKRPSREEMSKVSEVPRGQAQPPTRSGEGQANPGEGGAPQPSPEHHSAASPYPANPATCDHKRSSGAPAKFTDAEKVERCQKCGLPWIVVVEGTTADLGSA